MSSIEISLAKDPQTTCYAFAPGERLRIQVKFDDYIPERYRLQILDQKENSRLNRYGKGSVEGIVLDWPIPPTIRKEHLGIWHIRIEDYKKKHLITRSFFYVEHQQRMESPMLPSGPKILGLPETWLAAPSTIKTEEVIDISMESTSEITDVEPSQYFSETIISMTKKTISTQDKKGELPVTAVKGLGKTYADRLSKINIYSLSQFINYPNRIELAEIMRVNDKKLERMLKGANAIIEREGKLVITQPLEDVSAFSSNIKDLLKLPGIGKKSVEKLAKIGIHSKADLQNFKDHVKIRKILRMSVPRFTNLLENIGMPPISFTTEKVVTPDPLHQPVIKIKGIGGKTAEKLNSKGIFTVKDLINSTYTSLDKITSEKNYMKWKENAKILIN